MDRRNFIKTSVLAGGGLMLTFTISCNGDKKQPKVKYDEKGISHYIILDTHGGVHYKMDKTEMGQGVTTGMSMLLADELGVDIDNIKVESIVRTKSHFDLGISKSTGGSTSIMDMWVSVRNAAAVARNILEDAAASKWKVDVKQIHTKGGYVIHSNTGEKISFGEVVQHLQEIEVPAEPRLRDTKEYTYLGKPIPNKNINEIVNGNFKYGIDVSLPGMKYAAIVRSPVHKGKVKSYNSVATLRVSGVEQVIELEGIELGRMYGMEAGIAVIATNTYAAFKGANLLQVQWEESEFSAFDNSRLEEKVRDLAATNNGEVQLQIGNPKKIEDCHKTFELTFRKPYQTHLCMEPMNCIAHVNNDQCEIWAGTQGPFLAMSILQQQLGFEEEKIKINVLPAGGGFGRKYQPDYILEAVSISRKIKAPVKVTWTREDDVKHDNFHPYHYQNTKVGVNLDGELMAYDDQWVSPYWGGSLWLGYDIPNINSRVVFYDGPVQSGPWRSVVQDLWCFSQEVMIDHVAHEINKDPLDIRLGLLKKERMAPIGHSFKFNTKRMLKLVKLVSERANYNEQLEKNRAKSVVCYPYMHGNSYAAMVVDLELKGSTVKIHQMTCAVDVGLVINPDNVKQQIESGIVWGLSSTFYGRIDIANGIVQQSNFHDNPVLRLPECPKIDVIIVDSEILQPCGVGELSVGLVAPAICNALMKITGNVITEMPLTQSNNGFSLSV